MARSLETEQRPLEVIDQEAATTWTDDRLEELRRLWVEETVSSGEIAQRMGISRGTVMGKISRLGLQRYRGLPSLPTLQELALVQEPDPLPTVPSAADPMALETHALSTTSKHPTIFELRAGQCRFPLGEKNEPAAFFCGKPALAPKPYCRECCQRAYIAIRLR